MIIIRNFDLKKTYFETKKGGEFTGLEMSGSQRFVPAFEGSG
jgi:hypothetical protein